MWYEHDHGRRILVQNKRETQVSLLFFQPFYSHIYKRSSYHRHETFESPVGENEGKEESNIFSKTYTCAIKSQKHKNAGVEKLGDKIGKIGSEPEFMLNFFS